MFIAGIAVAILALAMVFFVGASIFWVSKRVTYNIKSRTLEMISVYDTLIEEKSEKVRELRRELKENQAETKTVEPGEEAPQSAAAAPPNFMLMTESMVTTEYLDPSLPVSYRTIKNTFRADPVKILKTMNISGYKKGPATELLETLDFDTVYELSSLPSERQVAILKENLSGTSLDMLNYYLMLGGQFSSIGFYDYLQSVAGNEASPVKLRIAPYAKYEGIPEGVMVITDDTICEGFQIEADNVLYDYCVKEKEIC